MYANPGIEHQNPGTIRLFRGLNGLFQKKSGLNGAFCWANSESSFETIR